MITLKNVSKSYKKRISAVKDVSIDIQKGEFVYLMGSSGSGKSSLMKLLYREEIVDKGNVNVAGHDVTKLTKQNIHELRRDIGVVFQNFRLLPNLTVYENIAYVLEVTGHPKEIIKERVLEILDFVGLKHKVLDYPRNCSGGEQQRVSIARALVNNPQVLLADEPTGNLDPKTAMSIMKLFYRINQKGTTVVMATHNQTIVNSVPFRVVELDYGKVIRDKNPESNNLTYHVDSGEYYVV